RLDAPTRLMDASALIEALSAEGPRLLGAATRAGWDAPVPGVDWDVRDLVVHTGGVQRWATTVVSGGSDEDVKAANSRVGAGPADDQLPDWFAAGHAALVDTLRAAPDDLDVFTFLPAPSPRQFWARRQAHETAVHRADAQTSLGSVDPLPVEFAQDGIAEMLHGFAARRRHAIPQPGIVLLQPTDAGAAWRVVFGGGSTRAERAGSDCPADSVVGGTSSDLYLWLWNRPAARVEVHGDAELAGLWRKAVRVTWQ
ncbi:MAG: maleylpyruvate isomerase family mycothiol-dependent enzyme, partial [Mycobacterium sp.]|nr:maleylpyruvate isomerase family mycothiol-dependent enzyme [Mycobacterium sp.]